MSTSIDRQHLSLTLNIKADKWNLTFFQHAFSKKLQPTVTAVCVLCNITWTTDTHTSFFNGLMQTGAAAPYSAPS